MKQTIVDKEDLKKFSSELKFQDQLRFFFLACIKDGKYSDTRKYNQPQVLVITPDCYAAIDLHKKVEGLNFGKAGYTVKSFKLFSKHMKPKEQLKTSRIRQPNG